MRRRFRRSYLNPATILTVAAMTVLSLMMAFPFIWMLSASLKTPATVFKLPPELWPYEWRIANYRDVLFHPSVLLPKFFLNSLKIATLVTMGQLVTCTLAAYAFARLRFPGRNALFVLMLTSLMVPVQITIIPTYILMGKLGLVDTHAALIIPSLVSIFGVFLLRQIFMTIPDELEDAARIDGAGPVRILWQIMAPLAGPGLSTLAIITFNGVWNSFFTPLIFINSWDKMTWPLGIAVLRGQYGETSVSVQMAAISIAVIPTAIVFVVGQRYIIGGITFTGIKA
jgi:multiple sugar transport system permease protein